jgi:acylpyruvate hydrolase
VRMFAFGKGTEFGLGIVDRSGVARGVLREDPAFPGTLDELLAAGGSAVTDAARSLTMAGVIDLDAISFRPPLACTTRKIICVGLNYSEHTRESGYEPPNYPALFTRYPSSFVGHREPLIRPLASEKFDYEGELVAVIGTAGRHISRARALEHVAGYSICNDGSIRDFQHRTPQWTMGKNFDRSGSFGPYFVTADEVPPGAKDLKLQTRLNGTVVQSASTSDMVFSVADLISIVSEAMVLAPGDIIVTGTPSGVGAGRKPPLWMKAGDRCEVEIDRLGLLTNSVADETGAKQ